MWINSASDGDKRGGQLQETGGTIAVMASEAVAAQASFAPEEPLDGKTVKARPLYTSAAHPLHESSRMPMITAPR